MEEQQINETCNLLKHAKKTLLDETVKITIIIIKTTIPSTIDKGTTIYKNFIYMKQATYPRWKLYFILFYVFYTLTPKKKISELENDIFQFNRELQLIYHLRKNNSVDRHIVTTESTNTLSLNENSDQENFFEELEYTETLLFKANDYLYKSRLELGSLIAVIGNKDKWF